MVQVECMQDPIAIKLPRNRGLYLRPLKKELEREQSITWFRTKRVSMYGQSRIHDMMLASWHADMPPASSPGVSRLLQEDLERDRSMFQNQGGVISASFRCRYNCTERHAQKRAEPVLLGWRFMLL